MTRCGFPRAVPSGIAPPVDNSAIRCIIMEDFPSPALFVYTLPNIVSGEICIRNNWGGESSAFVLEGYDEALIRSLVKQAFQDSCTESAFVAWIDCPTDNEWITNAWLVDKTDLLIAPVREGDSQNITGSAEIWIVK